MANVLICLSASKYNSRVIPCILFTIGITDTIKDKIIKYQIDSSNVIDILLNPLMVHESFRNTFFLLKNDEIIQNIKSIDLSKIEEVLEQSCCTDLSILLYKNRYDDIVKVINKLETSELLLFISKCNYEEVVNLCYNVRGNDINKSIKDTSKIYYIEILLSKNIKEEIPLEKIGKKIDIARCIMWLINDEYTTGQVISINGGWVIT